MRHFVPAALRRLRVAPALLFAPLLTILGATSAQAALVDQPGVPGDQGAPAKIAPPPDVVGDCNSTSTSDALITYFWGDAQGFQHERPTTCTYTPTTVKPYLARALPQRASADMNLCGQLQSTVSKAYGTTISNSVTTTDGRSLSVNGNFQLSRTITAVISAGVSHSYSTTSGTATSDTTSYSWTAPANKISYVQFTPYIIYSKGTVTAHYQYPTHGATTWTSNVIASAVPVTIKGSGELDGEFKVISRSC